MATWKKVLVSGSATGSDVGVENGATADQTAAEIKTLVGSASDSNVFTDADHTKLDGITAGADVTGSNSCARPLTTANQNVSGIKSFSHYAEFDDGLYLTSAGAGGGDLGLRNDGSNIQIGDFAGLGGEFQICMDDNDIVQIDDSGNTNFDANVRAKSLGVGTAASGTTGMITSTNVNITNGFKIDDSYGSDGQVLTSTGSGTAWETPSGGGLGSQYMIFHHNMSDDINTAEVYLPWAGTAEGTDMNTSTRAFLVPFTSMIFRRLILRPEIITTGFTLTVDIKRQLNGSTSVNHQDSTTVTWSSTQDNTYKVIDDNASPAGLQYTATIGQKIAFSIDASADPYSTMDWYITSIWEMSGTSIS